MTTTYQQPGHYIWASTGTGESSGDPIEVGEGLTGVLTIDADTDGMATVDVGPSVHELNVKAINDDGNSAVSLYDQLYIINGDTPRISKKNSGNFFGFALGTVGTGATKDIDVLLVNSLGPGTADILAGVVGTSELADDAVTSAKIADDAVTGAHIAATAVTGAHIAGDAIDGSKIADDAISQEHLDSGILPSHIVVYAGEATPATGSASGTITVTGATGTDLVVGIQKTIGTGVPKLRTMGAAGDAVVYTMSSAPGALDSVITYAVLRAVS